MICVYHEMWLLLAETTSSSVALLSVVALALLPVGETAGSHVDPHVVWCQLSSGAVLNHGIVQPFDAPIELEAPWHLSWWLQLQGLASGRGCEQNGRGYPVETKQEEDPHYWFHEKLISSSRNGSFSIMKRSSIRSPCLIHTPDMKTSHTLRHSGARLVLWTLLCSDQSQQQMWKVTGTMCPKMKDLSWFIPSCGILWPSKREMMITRIWETFPSCLTNPNGLGYSKNISQWSSRRRQVQKSGKFGRQQFLT